MSGGYEEMLRIVKAAERRGKILMFDNKTTLEEKIKQHYDPIQKENRIDMDKYEKSCKSLKNFRRPIFCKDCKHARRIMCRNLYRRYAWWRCASNPTKKRSYANEWTSMGECCQKNKDNDCVEFERKVRFWGWLRNKL